jgi:hypothetical protein
MAEAQLSSTEAALENQRIGPLQIRVAALCTLIQICDAYDVNAIAVTVPSLTHAWDLPGPALPRLSCGRALASWSARSRPGRSAIASVAGRCCSPASRSTGWLRY